MMKAYKGFNKDMTCRDFQYEEGKTYTEDRAVLCNTGFHACEDPLHCFGYYPPGVSKYHAVELEGVTPEAQSDDTKRCGTTISIGAELSVMDMVKGHFEFVKKNCEKEIKAGKAEAVTAGAHEAATAGDSGAATAGYRGAATAGDRGAATAGDSGAATAGYRGAATAGYRGAATAGDRGAATAGKYGRANGGQTAAVGEHGVAITKGEQTKVKGGIGAILVIAEEKDNSYEIRMWKAEQVDGIRIKPDTWYELDENGEFREVKE